MKIFKFRAKVIDSDKLDADRIVFGSLVDYGESEFSSRYWIHPPDGERNFPVDADSIAQFIGYDHDGNEVYEDDRLVGSDGTKWTAYLEFIGLTDEGFLHGVDLEDLTLIKEDAQ